MARDSHRDETRIISTSTVLILSAFLIGMATGNVIGTDLEPYVLSCGLAGMISFIGLELAAFRRKLNAIEEGKRIVEDRLDRHILSQSSSGFAMPTCRESPTARPEPEVAGNVA